MTQTAPEAPRATQPKPKPRKSKPTRKLARAAESVTRQAILRASKPPSLPEQIETLLMQGDLTALSVPERLVFYKDLCRSLGLNFRTRPFEYIVFTDRDQEDLAEGETPRGKMVLYARADCAAQLRKIHRVGIGKDMRKRREGEFYIVEADAFIHEKAGLRTDTATGIVWLKKWRGGRGNRSLVDLTGREMANAMMKAETKAKRRVTFSICGLHMLDESELADLTSMTYDVSESGRVIEIGAQHQEALPAASQEHPRAYDVAVYLAQADTSADDMKTKIDRHLAELRKQSPEQIDSLFSRLKADYEKKVSQPASNAQGAKAEGAQPKAETPQSKPAAGTAPSDYDGITLKALKNGLWEIQGSEALLRENREAIKKVLQRAALPGLACTAEGCGKLCRALEEAKVKFRMVNA